MAFNQGRNLYFNAFYFEDFGHETNDDAAISFWFTTFCHELAHNVASAHNKHHEAAEEALLTEHMVAMARQLGKPYIDASLL